MINSVFGQLEFNIGWKTEALVSLFNTEQRVTIKAAAYYEKDGITVEQEAAIADFGQHKNLRLMTIEDKLTDYAGADAAQRFTPRVLLFKRDGSYALLLEDKQNEEDGIVVCLRPEVKLLSQDEYL